jgi:carbon monoxide dehydrogenase subunit G
VADSTSSSIVINADPAKVLDVIADFSTYSEWAGVKDVEVLSSYDTGRAERVRLSIDAGIVKDTYVLEYEWEDSGVSWNLVEGMLQKAQQGSYRLSPESDGTRVDYQLAVDLALPIPGIFKRKGEKVIVDTALKGLKKRVEGLTP